MAALKALLQTCGLKVKSRDLDSFGRRPFALPFCAIIASLKESLACHKNTEKLALPCVPSFHQDEEGFPPPQPPQTPFSSPC